MNLDDLLAGFKASPDKERRKIKDVLERGDYLNNHFKTLEDLLSENFLISKYASFESTFEKFCSNIIFDDHTYGLVNYTEKAMLKYRMYCETVLNLMQLNNPGTTVFLNCFSDDIQQLRKLIDNGLLSCGYKIVEKKGTYVTEKIDLVAETISTIDSTYQEDIVDYLTSKTTKERENALTNLSIKLEAMEPSNNYVKQNKKYVQLLRHKEEKVDKPEYFWFFDNSKYDENLEKLFKIFIFMISYNDCSQYIKQFDKDMGGQKE